MHQLHPHTEEGQLKISPESSPPEPESVQQASVCLLVKWPHGAVTHTQPLVDLCGGQ